MAGQTPNLKMPYPLGTDPISDGDDQIKALAERIEARMPWGCLAYAEAAADVANVDGTTEVVISSMDITVTVIAGRRIRLFASMSVQSTVSGDTVQLAIKEGSTTLGFRYRAVTGTIQQQMYVDKIVTPSAGTHTYRIGILRNTGTGLVTAKSTPNSATAAWFMAEDLGPVSLA